MYGEIVVAVKKNDCLLVVREMVVKKKIVMKRKIIAMTDACFKKK